MLFKLWGPLAICSAIIASESSQNPTQTSSYPPITNRNGRSKLPGADFNIDFIYWLAQEDSLDYAYTGSGSSSDVGKFYQPEYNWQAGYRIGLSAYTSYDGWDVLGQYTWYKNSTQSSINQVDNLKPVWKITNFNSLTLTSASSNWSLDFNEVDLLLRRKYLLSKKFIVQPGIGLKGADFGQTYMISYDGKGNQNSTMKIHQHTYGVGISAACSSNWYFTPCLSVYGRVALSTLWFKSTIHRKDFSEDYNFGTEKIALNVEKDSSYVAPVFETFLGFSLKSSLYKKKIQAILIAGYEFQVWDDANQFIRMILDSNGSWGTLSLQGLTIRGQLEF